MKGFTLIEILLVIAIVLTVGFFSAAFATRLIPQMAVRDAQAQLKSVLRKAEAYSFSGRGKADWGVHYDNSVITLFRGNSYAQRDPAFDEQTQVHEKVSVANFSEVVFARPGGGVSGAIPNITLEWGSEAVQFSLNAEGALD